MSKKTKPKKRPRIKDIVLGLVSNLASSSVAKTVDTQAILESTQRIVAPIPIKYGYNPFSPSGFNMKECGITGHDEFDKQRDGTGTTKDLSDLEKIGKKLIPGGKYKGLSRSKQD